MINGVGSGSVAERTKNLEYNPNYHAVEERTDKSVP